MGGRADTAASLARGAEFRPGSMPQRKGSADADPFRISAETRTPARGPRQVTVTGIWTTVCVSLGLDVIVSVMIPLPTVAPLVTV